MDRKTKRSDKAKRNSEVKSPRDRSPEEIMEKPMKIVSMENPETDPNGSWTGVALNPYDEPVQDADDL